MSKNIWSKEELDILVKHFPTSTVEQLCKLLPLRHINSIYRKASYLHIRRKRDTEWTQDELDILIKNYELYQVKYIQELLPGRSLVSIYNKAHALGLSAYNKTNIDAEIKRKIGTCSISNIAKELGCPCSSISYRIQKLGL